MTRTATIATDLAVSFPFAQNARCRECSMAALLPGDAGFSTLCRQEQAERQRIGSAVLGDKDDEADVDALVGR